MFYRNKLLKTFDVNTGDKVIILRNKICDDPRKKDMFQDVDVKIWIRSYMSFDVNVMKHAFSPVDHHIYFALILTHQHR